MGKKVVSFKVDPDLDYRMELAARALGLNKSELIRVAVERFLAELEEKKRPVRTRYMTVW